MGTTHLAPPPSDEHDDDDVGPCFHCSMKKRGEQQQPQNSSSPRMKEKWKKEKEKMVNGESSRSSTGRRHHYYLLLLSLLHALLLPLAVSPASVSKWDGVIITQADYQGLQAFKHEITDPNGFLKSWNDSGIGACAGAWAGIKCVKGQVIAIQLPWRGLGGRITEKIGQLGALRKLSLHDNSIEGPVPAALGFLPDLRGVYLFNNRLSGAIPASIGNCPSLQTLDLSSNSLVGTIPPSVANSSLLYRLNLSHNLLSGSIPISIFKSVSLTFLSLQYNNLTGPIPDVVVALGHWGGSSSSRLTATTNLAINATESYQLQILNLDHNALIGGIPKSLGNLPMLQEFTLNNNKLNGSMPDELSKLSKLKILDLSANSIGGDFPASLCNLSSLVELSLDGNRLENSIPDAIDGLRNLSFLSLKQNHFDGPIPATIGNITTLSLLDLSDNNFTGEIPTSLVRLSNLKSFNVSDNSLSGPVPAPLAQKFNSSSFRGNLQLCGYSAAVPCPSSPPPANLLAILPPPSPTRKKLGTREIILVAAGSVLAVLLVLCCILLCYLIKRRSAQSKKGTSAAGAAARGEKPGAAGRAEAESGGETGGKLVHFDGPLVFTADDLLCATAEIMGKSTYGTVYKATLEDGNQVAVKRLREKIAKGQKEFEAEVNALGKIRHPNLLALRAYYLGPKGEKLLVFDYMPKGSLATFLHARGPDTPVDWATRMRIAIGTARGLHYLHTHENMIHGNLTSGNILLDEDTNAKIADFGLSRLMTAAASSSVIATAGALGYRAPELSKLKKASTKTDVYSLGVVILELLTGKSPGEAMNGVDLPQWVASIVKEEWTNEVFDLELMRDAAGTTGDELLNTLKLALHCVDPTPSARPEVHQVLHQLEEIKPEVAAAVGGGGGAGPSTSTTAAAAAEESKKEAEATTSSTS